MIDWLTETGWARDPNFWGDTVQWFILCYLVFRDRAPRWYRAGPPDRIVSREHQSPYR
jgi:steroid 5-alpha reductase family enzyme